MKKIAAFVIALAFYGNLYAQKYVPQIAPGTEVGYNISLNGQDIAFSLDVNSIVDSVRMTWTVAKYGSGTYVMAAKSLEEGKTMTLQAPMPDEVTKLTDNETMAFVSKSAFTQMKKDHVMEFDNLKYILDKNQSAPIKIGGKELDVLHAATADGKNEMWILNNPAFPLICKTRNAVLGADMTLSYIK